MNDKDNKIIALFMGLKPHHQDAGYLIDESKDEGYEAIHESCFLYDSSWDWLVPVVQKIEEECGGVPKQLLDVSFYDEIGDVYQAVVEFIKTYNDEK
jgi:hypothetical protein|tara:strand:+ start:196 stop:486 length:291 start_codon:yes stop_codon:yes gene_type:complete